MCLHISMKRFKLYMKVLVLASDLWLIFAKIFIPCGTSKGLFTLVLNSDNNKIYPFKKIL